MRSGGWDGYLFRTTITPPLETAGVSAVPIFESVVPLEYAATLPLDALKVTVWPAEIVPPAVNL